MIVTLRRIITQIFGSAQVEQIDQVSRTGAELAARRSETSVGIVGRASSDGLRSSERNSSLGANPVERQR